MNDIPGSSKSGGTVSKSRFYQELGFEDDFNPSIGNSQSTTIVPPVSNQPNQFADISPSPMVCYVLRLKHGAELRQSLKQFVEERNLRAAFIMSCVGSSLSAKLRLANATPNTETHYLLDVANRTEIVGLQGIVSGGGHLHVSLADCTGKLTGGHLIELVVDTTAEVVLGECTSLALSRVFDPSTDYRELQITQR